MFELVGFVIGIIIMCIAVMTIVEQLKKLTFIINIAEWFTVKIKRISFYQLLAFLVSLLLLIVLGWFGAVDLTVLQMILNSVLITFSANGVYTWYLKIFNK